MESRKMVLIYLFVYRETMEKNLFTGNKFIYREEFIYREKMEKQI